MRSSSRAQGLLRIGENEARNLTSPSLGLALALPLGLAVHLATQVHDREDDEAHACAKSSSVVRPGGGDKSLVLVVSFRHDRNGVGVRQRAESGETIIPTGEERRERYDQHGLGFVRRLISEWRKKRQIVWRRDV